MRTVSIVAAAFAFGIGTFAMTRDAHALGPVDLEIGLKAGGASNPFTTNTPNPLGFGLGGRAGIDFFNFYAGAQFTHYFGGSNQVSVAGIESGSVSYHANLYGVDLGYGITLLGELTIRPMLGIGNASIGSSATTQGLFSATVGQTRAAITSISSRASRASSSSASGTSAPTRTFSGSRASTTRRSRSRSTARSGSSFSCGAPRAAKRPVPVRAPLVGTKLPLVRTRLRRPRRHGMVTFGLGAGVITSSPPCLRRHRAR